MRKSSKDILKKMDAYKLMQKASKLHMDILDKCMRSELPATLVVGILECVRHTVLNYTDFSVYQALLEIGKEKKKGGKENEM